MSNIYRDKDTLLFIHDFFDSLDKNDLKYGDLNRREIFHFLQELLPKGIHGENLISGTVNEKGDKPAYFNQRFESIVINLDRMIIWLYENLEVLSDSLGEFKVDNDNLARYLILFVIIHEIEHSYQFLMSREMIVAPCQMLKRAYQDLFHLLSALDQKISIVQKARISISRKIYLNERDNFLLERNANVEAYDLLCRYAIFTSDEEMYQIFSWLQDGYEGIGYFDDRKGCLIHTYKSLLMHDRLWKIQSDIVGFNDEERIRYGLIIDENVRGKVLEKARRNLGD